MLKNKKGISLIVLIITIVVIIILASIIVINFSNNNPIERAREAKFKSDLVSFRDELEATHTENSINDSDYVKEDVNVEPADTVAKDEEKYQNMKKYIPSITKEYSKVLFIRKGKLMYYGYSASTTEDTDEDKNKRELQWSEDIGITPVYSRYGDLNGDGKLTIADAIILQKSIGNIITLTDEQKILADVDGNGSITISDAITVQKYIAGIIDKFPVEE